MLINLSFKNLLVVLLSLSASYGRFSVLKSLSSLFVFAWVLKIWVCSILVNDGVHEVLLLLVGKSINIDTRSLSILDLLLVKCLSILPAYVLWAAVLEFTALEGDAFITELDSSLFWRLFSLTDLFLHLCLLSKCLATSLLVIWSGVGGLDCN